MLKPNLNKRYVVVTSPEQNQGLKHELELATRFRGADGSELLIYRDNFIAYKVATLTGGRVQPGCIVVGDVTAEGDLTLEDGSRLRLEHAGFTSLS